jgi:hypothetical protein
MDICFDDDGRYAEAKEALTVEVIAARYKVDSKEVKRICWDEMRTIKLTVPRGLRAGGPGDRDVYGCQQHVPLLDIELFATTTGSQ